MLKLYLQVEAVKEKKARYHTYQRVGLALALVFLVLALCIFSLRYLWSPSLGKVRLNITSLFASYQTYCHCMWKSSPEEREMNDMLSFHISKSYRLHQRKKIHE